ncbi:MetQ/NlpA family ABC transporter substrate-binding protein, partial [Staphylococcus epidermidis]|uniref:MetQ/NlpA family ABC transporter substrate-binding protein n=1 Tax=Staphylococcus epidermidis TaxID=1282 RepID=UPI0021B239CC
FLHQYKKPHKHTNIQPLTTTLLPPLPIYSHKLNNIKHVKKGPQVPIPNDLSNQPPPLNLLQSPPLINLNNNFPLNPTTKHIQTNPKHLKIKALHPQQTPPPLSHLHISLINNPLPTKPPKHPKNHPIYFQKPTSHAVKPY